MAGGRQRDEQRTRIAADAARLMLETGLRDYGQAKRKAGARHGVRDERALPTNQEVDAALREHQRLFRADAQPSRLRTLREAALEGLSFFAAFEPRLAGPVLDGSADAHTPVTLHLHVDDPHAVRDFLVTQGVEFDEDVVRVRLDRARADEYPRHHFDAGGVPVELLVLPTALLRQAPLDPVDEKPMRRAGAAQLRALLAAPEGS